MFFFFLIIVFVFKTCGKLFLFPDHFFDPSTSFLKFNEAQILVRASPSVFYKSPLHLILAATAIARIHRCSAEFLCKLFTKICLQIVQVTHVTFCSMTPDSELDCNILCFDPDSKNFHEPKRVFQVSFAPHFSCN